MSADALTFLERLPGWLLVGRRDGSAAIVHAGSVAAIDQADVQVSGRTHLVLRLRGGGSIDLHPVVTLEAASDAIADALERGRLADERVVRISGPSVDLGGDREHVRVQHGITCKKQPHTVGSHYQHDENDDGVFQYDGRLPYCGRCHDPIRLQVTP